MKNVKVATKRMLLFTTMFLVGLGGQICRAQAVGDTSAPGKSGPVFSLDFDKGFTATTASGDLKPVNANLPELVDGIKGKAALFPEGTVLQFPAQGILSMKRGSVSFWLQPGKKYLPKEPKDFLYLFNTDAPGEPGETPFCLWTVGKDGLRFDILDRPTLQIQKNIFASQRWKPGEWHHIVLTWDSSASATLCVDGDILMFNKSLGEAAKVFIPSVKFNLKEVAAFFFGAFDGNGRMAWDGAIDEVRIFDRQLSLEETRAEIANVWQFRARQVDSYLFAGATGCRVSFENMSGAPMSINPHYSLEDAQGAKITDGEAETVALKPHERRLVTFPLDIPQPGSYVLKISVPALNSHAAEYAYDLMALPQKETPVGTGKRELVAEVNAVTQEPLAEATGTPTASTSFNEGIKEFDPITPSIIVDSPLGKYRETSGVAYSRFAMKFTVKDLHVPHIAVFTWPDDKVRTMEIIYQPMKGRGDFQGQTGLYAGREYPNTGKFQEHTITFWPTSEENAFVFATVEKGAPAAVQGFKVYRLDGFAASPVRPFNGTVPARSIGMYHEDPCLFYDYGSMAGENITVSKMGQFPGFKHVIDRMLDYLQSFGQNTLNYPIGWYQGPTYNSEVEPFPPYARQHPKNFDQYLLKRLQARGMKLNAWLHLQQLKSLNPYCLLDEARIIAGEETALNMRDDGHLFYAGWHHRDPCYNPIDPHVTGAVKAIIGEMAERYANEPALEGVTLNVNENDLFAFGSIKSGYNDINLKRFQEDCGIEIPVDPKSADRHAKSAKWILDNAKEKWISWRCRKIHDYYKELAAVLRAVRPDLKLGISLYVYPVNYGQNTEPVDYLNSKRFSLDWYRELGVDPALFLNDPEIEFIRTTDVRERNNRRERGDQMNIEDLRTASLAPEFVAPLRQLPSAGFNMHDVYWESTIAGRSPMKAEGFKEAGLRISEFNPNTFHCLERYACGMEALDPVSFSKGGFTVGFNSMEPYLARYAQAFRALPAVKFDDVAGVSDPVRARQKVVDGKNYFYLQNRLPVQVDATVTLKGGGAVTDLVSGTPVARTGNAFKVSMEPYQLYAYCSDNTKTAMESADAKLPDGFVQKLGEKLDQATAKYEALKTNGIPVEDIEPYLKYAVECRDAKRYARLYFLLQESWCANLARIAAVPEMNEFRQAPPEYLQSVQRVRTLHAVKTDSPVQLDGKLNDAAWSKAPEFTDMSNFLTVRNKFFAKPATEKMSVRLLYDDKNLYVGVFCKDSSPDKIIVKKLPRDGKVWINDDAVEVFLQTPGMGVKGIAQLAVNAGGSQSDLLSGNLEWNAEWQAAAALADGGWTAEFAIPFDSLSKGSTSASGWTFNIVRTNRDFRKTAMVGTMEDEWKCGDLFARIEFE